MVWILELTFGQKVHLMMKNVWSLKTHFWAKMWGENLQDNQIRTFTLQSKGYFDFRQNICDLCWSHTMKSYHLSSHLLLVAPATESIFVAVRVADLFSGSRKTRCKMCLFSLLPYDGTHDQISEHSIKFDTRTTLPL